MPVEYMCSCQNSIPCVGGYALRAPLYLPPIPEWTIRVRLKQYEEGPPAVKPGATVTKLYDDLEIYDVTYQNTDWSNMLKRTSADPWVEEILGANVSGVTNMSNMFYNQRGLTMVAPFDTSLVTNFTSMFENCVELENIPAFNTASATTLYGMFQNTHMREAPMLDTSYVTDMGHMFASCGSLRSVPLYDTSNVTNMNSMFGGCGVLTSVPLFDTSKVTNMGNMFNYCSHLTSVPLFDTSKVTTMNSMFYHCGSLENLPLFDTSRVTDMANMCYGAKLLAIPLFDTSSVTTMNRAFYSCVWVESGALALYNQVSTQANPPATHIETFHKCGSENASGAAELAQIPSDWK